MDTEEDLDHPSVFGVTEVDYEVSATRDPENNLRMDHGITLMPGADSSLVIQTIRDAAVSFATQASTRFQQDIVPEEWIVALGCIGGVYRVVFDEDKPVYQRLAVGEWANCTSIILDVYDYGIVDEFNVLHQNRITTIVLP